MKSKKLKLKIEKKKNEKTTKFTKFIQNLKGFFLKKKKIITKKRVKKT